LLAGPSTFTQGDGYCRGTHRLREEDGQGGRYISIRATPSNQTAAGGCWKKAKYSGICVKVLVRSGEKHLLPPKNYVTQHTHQTDETFAIHRNTPYSLLFRSPYHPSSQDLHTPPAAPLVGFLRAHRQATVSRACGSSRLVVARFSVWGHLTFLYKKGSPSTKPSVGPSTHSPNSLSPHSYLQLRDGGRTDWKLAQRQAYTPWTGSLSTALGHTQQFTPDWSVGRPGAASDLTGRPQAPRAP